MAKLTFRINLHAKNIGNVAHWNVGHFKGDLLLLNLYDTSCNHNKWILFLWFIFPAPYIFLRSLFLIYSSKMPYLSHIGSWCSPPEIVYWKQAISVKSNFWKPTFFWLSVFRIVSAAQWFLWALQFPVTSVDVLERNCKSSTIHNFLISSGNVLNAPPPVWVRD